MKQITKQLAGHACAHLADNRKEHYIKEFASKLYMDKMFKYPKSFPSVHRILRSTI